ncbi:ankyrin [Acephala macrosclerotiorum]|nr:ankyrin [Acephala macrosclerotiorum]
MDPVSILGLVGTCFSIGLHVASAASGVRDVINGLQSADQSIARLASQLDIFCSVMEQLRLWLERDPSLSSSLRGTIGNSLTHCDVIVSEIEQRVAQVKPKPEESKSSFGRRLKHLWTEESIKENKPWELERMVQQSEAEDLFARSAEDALSISVSKSLHQKRQQSTIDDGQNLDVKLSVDDEITSSGPYVRHYRDLMKRLFESRSDSPNGVDEIFVEDVDPPEIPPITLHSRIEMDGLNLIYTPFPQTGSLKGSVSALTKRLIAVERENSLFVASSQGDMTTVKKVLASGVSIDRHDSYGYTALSYAVSHGQMDAARYLLKWGANVHLGFRQSASSGPHNPFKVSSPIHMAVLLGSSDMIQALIDHGADINDPRCEVDLGSPSPHSASDGTGLNIDGGIDRITPLHLVCLQQGTTASIVGELIQLGANVSAQDSFERTPIMNAVHSRNIPVIQENLRSAAPVDMADKFGWTPLKLACSSLMIDSERIVDLLIRHGADVNKPCGLQKRSVIFDICPKSTSSGLHSTVFYYLIRARDLEIHRGASKEINNQVK